MVVPDRSVESIVGGLVPIVTGDWTAMIITPVPTGLAPFLTVPEIEPNALEIVKVPTKTVEFWTTVLRNKPGDELSPVSSCGDMV